ncbi:MAG: tRNA (adenosine(37)-N6)-threonylcarbamoyltransferase complex dimerization subunit type 1 TsaB, partial [Rhodospirillaceae bacterium]|nr:tRNA (adenosine(37)-N6)-threonylcarbamoyltransferase complex dimerization subunit type 1 TsaB [Rhodospirillaceae bacterium]
MKVLAIDTATSACSVAIWQDGDVIARRFEAMSRGQAEFLMPMIG